MSGRGDDLISRQEAIDALGEEPEVWMNDDDYALGQRNQWQCDVTALKAVQSAQPERKTGKWILTGKVNIFGVDMQCSECGESFTTMEIKEEIYCRHCGAYMGR